MNFIQTAAVSLLGGGLVAALPPLVQAFFGRGKGKADAAGEIADSAVELLAPFREQIKELRAEVTELRAAVRRLTKDVDDRDRIIRERDAQILRLSTANGHPDYT